MSDRLDEDLDARSLADLLTLLRHDARTLVQQEIELAKVELRDKARSLGIGVVLVVAAVLLGALALGGVTAAAVLALAIVLPGWAAALIVAFAEAVVALLLAVRGRDRIRAAMPPVPQRTFDMIREDVEWAKHQTKSVETSPQREDA